MAWQVIVGFLGIAGTIITVIFSPGPTALKIISFILISFILIFLQYFVPVQLFPTMWRRTKDRILAGHKKGYGTFVKNHLIRLMNESMRLYLANEKKTLNIVDLTNWNCPSSFLPEIQAAMKGGHLLRSNKTDFSNKRTENIFDSFFNYFLWNCCHKIWFMPPLCLNECIQLNDMYKEFQVLGLKDWNRFTIGEDYGMLAKTKSLFITWDLSKLEKWSDDEILALNGFLTILKSRTNDGGLIVHRILILPDDIGANMEKRGIFKNKFYDPYFKGINNGKYKISWIKENSVDNALIDDEIKKLFRDIALFSSAEFTPPISDRSEDYNLIQFSTNYPLVPRTEKILLLLFALDRDTENAPIFDTIINNLRDFYSLLDRSKCLRSLNDLCN